MVGIARASRSRDVARRASGPRPCAGLAQERSARTADARGRRHRPRRRIARRGAASDKQHTKHSYVFAYIHTYMNMAKKEIQLPLSASCLPIKLQMFRVRVSDSWAFFGPAKRRPRRRLRGLGKLSPCGASAARVHSAPTGSLGAPADTQASGRAARRSGRCIAARRHAGSVASTTVRHRGTASPSPRSSCPAAQFAARSSYSPRTAVSTNACVRRGSP